MKTARGTPKTERVFKHCLYEIATGAWESGRRLPSLREARDLWSVNHLTALRAYRRLEELGLVESVPRSGFFVADDTDVSGLARHRDELQRTYNRLRGRITKEGMSVVGAFRYLAQLAETRARDEPECAFVECTAFQAEGHANEIRDRLRVPCLPLTTEDPIPRHVQTVITTSFHIHEVGRGALAVPIEFAADVPRGLPREVIVFATDVEVAKHAARDAKRALGRKVEAAQSSIEDLPKRLEGAKQKAVVLSPSLWTALPEKLKRTRRFLPLIYKISESAWPRIAESIGLPLGTLV